MVRDDAVEEFVGYDHLEADLESPVTARSTPRTRPGSNWSSTAPLSTLKAEDRWATPASSRRPDGTKTSIVTTKRENNLILHITEQLAGRPFGQFHGAVNATKRTSTEHNHTATHLLHEALRDVLGTHVEQRGSLVKDAALRFDFSAFPKMTPEELLA